MIKVDNSMFGGAQNAAHFERDGVSICMPTDTFWSAVKGDSEILIDSAESALAAEAAECMSEIMPIVLDKPYQIDADGKKMFFELSVLAKSMLDNYNTCMIDFLIFFCVPLADVYFGVACLRSKLMIALAKGENGSDIIYANSSDYMFIYDSIREFNMEMLSQDDVNR